MTPDRYDRLLRFGGFGAEGYKQLLDSTICIIGCGGLGGGVIIQLARYPVGALRIIDRDMVEETNLAHQLLFLPRHIESPTPKVTAAAGYVEEVNPSIRVEPVFEDMRGANAEELLRGSHLVLDGLDNFRARFTVNDACLKLGIPYVYGGVVEGEATMKAVLPGRTSCLRCLMPEPPPPGATRTCDRYGVHLPIIPLLSSLMVDSALAILAGSEPSDIGEVIEAKLGQSGVKVSRHPATARPNPDCPACAGRYDFLGASDDERAASVCGTDAIALNLGAPIELGALTSSLPGEFEVKENSYLVEARDYAKGLVFTVFKHGRVVLEGSEDETQLRSFVSRFLGD